MTVLLERRDGGIAVLTLNRPAAANALDAALHGALVAALASAAAEGDVRGVVLTAAGERVFSAGADLKEFAELDPAEAGRRRRRLLVETLLALAAFPTPLVAMVQAKAVGAGVMLAALADEIVASESASFSLPEIRLGMPSPLGYEIVAARTGGRFARRMVQTGESVDAALALAVGLADALVPAAALAARATERARALAEVPAAAFAANKAWIERRVRAAIESAAAEAARLHDGADSAARS